MSLGDEDRQLLRPDILLNSDHLGAGRCSPGDSGLQRCIGQANVMRPVICPGTCLRNVAIVRIAANRRHGDDGRARVGLNEDCLAVDGGAARSRGHDHRGHPLKEIGCRKAWVPHRSITIDKPGDDKFTRRVDRTHPTRNANLRTAAGRDDTVTVDQHHRVRNIMFG